MQDLDDLAYFAAVVRHGGFAAAGRVLKQPKSKLSRRVARLEERLKVHLLERSARRFRITEIGMRVFEQCENALIAAETVEALAMQAQAAPRGVVRVSTLPGLTNPMLTETLPAFLSAYPDVRVELTTTARHIDFMEDRIDVALSVYNNRNKNEYINTRVLGSSEIIIVASPKLLGRDNVPKSPADLSLHPTLSMATGEDTAAWELHGPDSVNCIFNHEPRLISSDTVLLLEAARIGQGIAALPIQICRKDIEEGMLVRVLPNWNAGEAIIHLASNSRRGLMPAVRAFVDFMATEIASLLTACAPCQASD